MNQTNRAIAIVVSVVVIVVCLALALAQAGPSLNLSIGGRNVDETKTAELGLSDSLLIDSTFSSVAVTTDASAANLTAHLLGSVYGLGLGSGSELEITQSGGTVSVTVGKNWKGHIGWRGSLRLEVVIPAGFSGSLSCNSSAGDVSIGSDLSVKSLQAHSSAGSVRVQNITSTGSVELTSSAGEVTAQNVQADSVNLESSAGRVQVGSCVAKTIRLHSSAGGVSADSLSGKLDITSSAGSVNVGLEDVVDSADISSSASSVTVTLPSGAAFELNAWSSAGSVSVNGLTFTSTDTQKKQRVQGKVGGGGPQVSVHSSAGSVSVNGN